MSFESMPSTNDEQKPESVQESLEKWDEIKDIDLRKLDSSSPEEYLESLSNGQIQRAVDFLDREIKSVIHSDMNNDYMKTELMKRHSHTMELLVAEQKRRTEAKK